MKTLTAAILILLCCAPAGAKHRKPWVGFYMYAYQQPYLRVRAPQCEVIYEKDVDKENHQEHTRRVVLRDGLCTFNPFLSHEVTEFRDAQNPPEIF